MKGSTRATVLVAWLAAGLALFILATIIVGVAMAVSMGNGMMADGDAGPQTPVVATGPEFTVDIIASGYSPRELVISAGSSVTWVNTDHNPHTATDRHGAWDTGNLKKDESQTITFDEPGTYGYVCVYHLYMKARLTVR
jgi:plastocyanin